MICSTSLKLIAQPFCAICILLITSACTEPKPDYNWQLIEGFPKPLIPADNPITQAKVTLGRYLFYDKNLSANGKQSCASCHQQASAFAENKAVSVGSTGESHRRNAQSLVNIAYNKTLTWAHDGLTSIERQILIPMFSEHPIELGITGHDQDVLARFNKAPYDQLFANAFPKSERSFDLIVKALASFVRSLTSLNSPFDQYAYAFDDTALSQSAVRGMTLFFSESLECHHCHGGFNFTQSTSHETQQLDLRPFHNIGLYNVNNQGSYPKKDIGLAELSERPQDNGRFRAPTLRNIAVSAPYMHDGSLKSLDEVIEFYSQGGRNIDKGSNRGNGAKNPNKSPFIKGFELTDKEKGDLKSFLHSLTDKGFLNDARHSDPWMSEVKNE